MDSSDGEDLDAPCATVPKWNSSLLDSNPWILKNNDGYFCSLCQITNASGKGGVWIKKPCVKKDGRQAIYNHKNSSIHKASVAVRAVQKDIVEHQIDSNEKLCVALTKRVRDIGFARKSCFETF
eukprot:Pompholyxophrys_punicea_v1_NODE_702_length_1429_cov_2.272198.p2 type:complete len:124 gc:universal NODE_702_length_1429_cov_2.272198:268-639(+)